MTNLEAMQDEQLLELIRDVEKLERLYAQVKGIKFAEKVHCLESELLGGRKMIQLRWKELMEKDND